MASTSDSTDHLELSPGPCHYSDFGEDATALEATHNGTGWIRVCDSHRQRAVDESYEIVDE